MSNRPDHTAPPSFLLFDGGPLADLQRALRLTRPGELNAGRTIVLAVCLAWVPLVILTAVEGTAVGPLISKPMLRDIAMYARFLVALPLLLLAPAACRSRLQMVIRHFLEAGLVQPTDEDRFVDNVATTLRIRDGRWTELLALALAYAHAVFFVASVLPAMGGSWRTVGMGGDLRLSWAGWWFVLVSQPLYNFVACRFVFRVVLWWRFLRQTARLDLQLNANHPDKAGGLAFLGLTLGSFAVPVLAISASLAGGLADLVLWSGASVISYKFVIAAIVVLQVLLFAAPLLFFVGQLGECKRRGIIDYGTLAARQLRDFERKWIPGSAASDAERLTAPDFSAVTDFNATVAAVHEMNVLPFGRADIVPLLLAAILPFLPVAALEIPLRDLLGQVLKLVM